MMKTVPQQSTRRDLAAELDAEGDEFPESWRPRPGDKLVGTVVRYTEGDSRFGPKWVCVLRCVNDAGAEYLCSVWLSHTVLYNEFLKLRPRIAERIGIKRLSDEDSAGGRYARYLVRVDRPPAASEPDWEKLARAAGAQPLPAPAATTSEDEKDNEDVPW